MSHDLYSFDQNLRDGEPFDDKRCWLFSITREIESKMHRTPSTSRECIQVDEHRAY
jgi:hypothetical protein